MPELSHKELNTYLKKAAKEGFAPVYLIFGEEVLYKSSLEAIVNAILPSSERSLCYEPLYDGTDDRVYDAIELLNTYSLMSGRKVVALCDSKIFYSKEDETSLIEKAKESYDQEDMKKASKYLIALMGLLNLSFDDLSPENRTRSLKSGSEKIGDGAWMDEVIAYCQENNLSVSGAKDRAGDLQRAIEKGFPDDNFLMITTDLIDRRRGLYNIIKEKGMVIDCFIPRGDRKADRMAQEALLKERMKAILEKSNKTMSLQAFTAMYEMTGFDVRTFSMNLEKLVSYIGKRREITLDDVNALLSRTKQDPIYELTGAVTDKNLPDILFYLNSLLSSGFLPTQILGAVVNQFRKLIIIKDFVESPEGRAWHKSMPYDLFQTLVIPLLVKYDEQLKAVLTDWKNKLSDEDRLPKKETKKKEKKKPASPETDLLVVKNPGNIYPVYQMFLKSERFTKQELLDALESLSIADMNLKTTGRNPKQVLEEVIFRICK